jgi:chemotaxis protein methyltransferase CheR
MDPTNHLNEGQFQKFSRLIYDQLGIHIQSVKKEMLKTKLDKLMRQQGIASYDEYYQRLTRDGKPEDWVRFSDEITINKTDFFRENHHFEFIQKQLQNIMDLNPRIQKEGLIRVWSAGCSTGEEPYTLAMVLRETLPAAIQVKILATDLSHRVLVAAQRGVYNAADVAVINPYYLQRYFSRQRDAWKVTQEIKDLITFRQFNLMEHFPFQNKFDMIFCRNVMIYFDPQTQQDLVNRFYDVLIPGGLLFIGHSESLTNKRHHFQYLQPTIYRKNTKAGGRYIS